MNDNAKSIFRWISGIVGTVAAGFILWWLTNDHSHPQPGSSTKSDPVKYDTGSDPKQESPKAVIEITRFDIKSPININESTSAEFEISNKGQAATTGCRLIWNLPGMNNNLTYGPVDLMPGESKSFSLGTNNLPDSGDIITTAFVECSNCNSQKTERHLVVEFKSGDTRFLR